MNTTSCTATYLFHVDSFEILQNVLIVLVEVGGQLRMIEKHTDPERWNLADQIRTWNERSPRCKSMNSRREVTNVSCSWAVEACCTSVRLAGFPRWPARSDDRFRFARRR